jgi:nucleotide-binding universal stress UspA family protein
MTYKIFVPMDGSDCAERALRHAIALAKRIGDASIHVVHAHDAPVLYGEIAVYVPRDEMERLQREQSERHLARAEAVLKTAGVPFQKEVLIGPIAQALTERAKALGCDAIVMGTHGMTALGKFLIGSTATKVVHLSEIPVTLVK